MSGQLNDANRSENRIERRKPRPGGFRRKLEMGDAGREIKFEFAGSPAPKFRSIIFTYPPLSSYFTPKRTTPVPKQRA
jgi:hypothetical protein